MASSPEKPPPLFRPFVIGLVLAFVSLFAVVRWQDYQAQFVYAVTIDGQALGLVASKEQWRQALENARSAAETSMGTSVVLQSNVELTKVRPAPGEPVLAGAALAEACRTGLVFAARAWAIAVDGKPVAYVRTEAEARQVVPGLLDDYRKTLLKKGNTTVLSVGLDRNVTYYETQAPVGKVGGVEEAKKVLLRGTDKTLVHTVKPGESLWSIARSASLTVADLRKANPDISNLNLIHVGQEINLIVPDPYVNLQSTERYTYIKYLPFPETVRRDPSLWPYEGYVEKAGVYGRDQVTVEIDRTNGDETARRLVSERNLSQPSTQVYVEGSKVYPTRPGGLVWPAPGRITSPYGYRRGGEFHHGIDIGAPYGCEVLAVAAGTVTLAGWHGNLGRCVIIDHGNGLESIYGHLSAVLVSVGDTVRQGAVIGRVGNTGRSTGAHLHLELHLNGKTVNPLGYYPHGG